MRDDGWSLADDICAELPRRRALGLLALALLSGKARARGDEGDGTPEVDLAAVRDRAGACGLGPLSLETSGRYQVIGDAPRAFLAQALKLCEALADDYQSHFTRQGFPVRPPGRKLTVVALAGPESFAAFTGQPADEALGGFYDLDSNRLLILDNRGRADAGREAARANTVALMHEATHQLTFNTGLLDRQGDVPLVVSEGLAVYAEVRRPDGRTRIGAVNRERLAAPGGMEAAPALEDLIRDDECFRRPELVQAAYARSWLLIHFLMKTPARTPALVAYLDRIRPRRDALSRLDDARATLGDLPALDRLITAHGRRLR